MLMLDTCALIWWTMSPEQLSKKATEACQNMEKNGQGLISSISIWEIGIKVKNNKLDIGMSIEEYTQHIRDLGYLSILAVDEHIWLKNISLDWQHRDPADRTIVASALLKNCSLVTADENIIAFYENTIW